MENKAIYTSKQYNKVQYCAYRVEGAYFFRHAPGGVGNPDDAIK
jgi:hypothetical protein